MTAGPGLVRRPVPWVVAVLILAVISAAVGYVCLQTAFVHETAATVWGPAGVALAAFLFYGIRLWPGVLIGALVANLLNDSTLGGAIVLAVAKVIEVSLATLLVRRFSDGRHTLNTARNVLLWALLTGVLATAIGSTISTAGLWLVEGAHATPGLLWATLWLGDSAGILLIAPFFILWGRNSRINVRGTALAENVGFLVMLFLVATLLFSYPLRLLPATHYPLGFLLFPIMAWAAFRLGSRTTATAIIILTVLGTLGTMHNDGPFAVVSTNGSLMLLHAFLTTTATTTLAVAAAVDERQRAQRQVGILNAELQQRVSERTAALARSETLLIEAQELRSRAEAEEERSRFLAESSSLLGASLEYGATLSSLAKLTVPRIGDWCSVQLLRDDGTVEQIALAHIHPEKIEKVQRLAERWPPDPASTFGVHEVIRTGTPQMGPVITDEMLVESARSEEHLEFMRSLGLYSYLLVPLKARGHILGAMTFIRNAGNRPFDEADLALTIELAARAATAVENTRLFAKAQEAVRVREDFLAIASHELRTPVTSLRLQVQIVERALADELARSRVATEPFAAVAGLEKVLGLTRVLGEDSRRLVRLVNGLLDVTRIATGKLDLQPEDLDFRDIVRFGIEALRPDLATGKIKLTYQAPDPLPGRWDRLRMEQVIGNLLSNAVKYGGGQPITVRAEAEGDWVVLTVQDRGAGIATEFRHRMFDRFQQGASGTQGLGLGLYITRQIVESHGGTIEAVSPPGEGATFVVRLPRITEARRSAAGRSIA